MSFKIGKLVSHVVVLSLISMFGSNASANRLADQKKEGTHCNPLPAHKCEPGIKNWRKRGCITQVEAEYALGIRPMRVPQCVETESDVWEFNAWCYCSCFASGTKVLVEDKENLKQLWLEVERIAENVDRYRLVVPRADARLNQMTYETHEIAEWTQGFESSPLIFVKGNNGRDLTITGNHRVVLENGSLVEASLLKVGDALLDYSGNKIEVVGIDQRIENEKVYNFLTLGSGALSHLMFAEGFLVGDLLWENSPEEETNAVKFPH